jgi:tricorn protease
VDGEGYFYDPALHGLDWKGVYDRYLPQLAFVQRREDLNDLLVQMIAELQVGHNRTGGGDVHQEPSVAVGLLGADFRISAGPLPDRDDLRGRPPQPQPARAAAVPAWA